MDIALAIREFLEHIEIERNRSKNTIESYRFYLGRFLKWADAQQIKSVEHISRDTICAYRLWLDQLHKDKPLKKSTQNYHLIAIRSFLKYLTNRNITTLAPKDITLAKMPSRTISFLDGDNLERFLAMPTTTDDPLIIKRRDRAILELFFSTGLRISELAALRRENVNLSKDEFAIRGAGDAYRIVLLSPRAKKHIKKYFDVRADKFDSLFLRHDRAFQSFKKIGSADSAPHLTPRSIQRLVQKYARMAGISKHITPHGLRHSFAADRLANGADIHSVQTLLGHTNIATTHIYTHITNQQLHEVHKAFHDKKIKK